jgi:hypothetical protein
MPTEAREAFMLEPGLLLTAAVARLAKTIDARILAVKGVASVAYSLRPPRHSSDVDVLVEPDRFDDLVETLSARGWSPRPSDPDTSTFPRHSVSLFHADWSMDVDVHFRYPGIELHPAETFERLWSQRTTLWCGSQPVQIPGLADAIIVNALHALRGLWIQRHAAELDYLVERCRSIDVGILVARATELEALATTRPFLERLLPRQHDIVWGEPSEEWLLRTRITEPMQRRAVLWRRAGWRERLRQARLALFPPVDALLKETTLTRLGPLSAARAYTRRWVRGLAAVPRILPILLARLPDERATSVERPPAHGGHR